MISGGQHKNIFGVNLGQYTLDRDIKKLLEEIGGLQKKLSELTDDRVDEINAVTKEIARAETEIELLK